MGLFLSSALYEGSDHREDPGADDEDCAVAHVAYHRRPWTCCKRSGKCCPPLLSLLFSFWSRPLTHRLLSIASCSSFQIKLDDRYNEDWMFDATLYVDCIDFMIEEPDARDKWWYSHKSNGPGLRYEVATSIQTGLISWASGPWRAGLWHEQEIFKNGLDMELEEGEPVHADRGYSAGAQNEDGEVIFITPNSPGMTEKASIAHGRLHGRHEGVNGKLKRFSVLENRFRHNLDRHGECFFAVVTLVQLEMVVETKPFHVEYSE